jgi:hypothetical protein
MQPSKSLPSAFLSVFLTGVFLFPISQSLAGGSNKNGNPYGNGTFFDGGTFSAVIRGQNLSGTMLVSAPPGVSGGSNSTSTNGSGGVATIIIQGQTFQANANANVDANSSQIAGNFYGGYELSGQGSNSVLTTNTPVPITSEITLINTNYQYNISTLTNTNISTNFFYTNQIYTNIGYVTIYATNPDTGVITATNFPSTNVANITSIGTNYTTNYNTTSYTNTNTIIVTTNTLVTNYMNIEATTTYNDAVDIVGAFGGGLQNSYPNQTFNANGQVTQTSISFVTNEIPTTVTTNYPITVQGIMISSAMETFATYSNAVPYATTVYSQTNLGGTN